MREGQIAAACALVLLILAILMVVGGIRNTAALDELADRSCIDRCAILNHAKFVRRVPYWSNHCLCTNGYTSDMGAPQ